MITLAKRNILRKDCNGFWYSIPEEMVDQFIQLSETVENSETISDEWHSAQDEFDNVFGSFLKE